jgi:hypothetical protein
MQTPEQQAKELEAQVEDSNTLVLNPNPRQLMAIGSVTHDKKIIQDRLEDVVKREKDIVNLILDAHNVDPMIVKEVQMHEGRMIITKHPIEKESRLPTIPLPSLPQPTNGIAEVKQ